MPTAAELALGNIENQFRSAVEDVEGYISNATATSGSAQWAILHLVGRSLADLKCGMFLVTSGYIVQMYSVIRPVKESLNLIRLFEQQPEKADEWAAGNYREFTPAKVRDALGGKDDPIYSWMSEHSHPRFAAAQLSTYSTGPARGVILSGGMPLDHPQVLLAAALPGDLLTEVAFAAGQIPMARAAALDWPSTVASVIEKLIEGVTGLFKAIYATVEGVPSQEIADNIVEVMKTNLALAREIETAVEEAARDE
jgi:hypothetical protein